MALEQHEEGPRVNSLGRALINSRHVVPIIADAALWLQTEVEGMPVPLVILDTTDHPALAENIRMHAHVGSGDVKIRWGSADERVALLLDFIRPVETNVVILFDVRTRGIVVDAAVRAGAIYLQAGSPGDRLISTLDAPRILVDVGGVGFEPYWEDLFQKGMLVELMSRGLNRKSAKAAAKEAIELLRSTFAHRLLG